MEIGLIGFSVGVLLSMSIYTLGGWSGLIAERNARVRRASLRARRA